MISSYDTLCRCIYGDIKCGYGYLPYCTCDDGPGHVEAKSAHYTYFSKDGYNDNVFSNNVVFHNVTFSDILGKYNRTLRTDSESFIPCNVVWACSCVSPDLDVVVRFVNENPDWKRRTSRHFGTMMIAALTDFRPHPVLHFLISKGGLESDDVDIGYVNIFALYAINHLFGFSSFILLVEEYGADVHLIHGECNYFHYLMIAEQDDDRCQDILIRYGLDSKYKFRGRTYIEWMNDEYLSKEEEIINRLTDSFIYRDEIGTHNNNIYINRKRNIIGRYRNRVNMLRRWNDELHPIQLERHALESALPALPLDIVELCGNFVHARHPMYLERNVLESTLSEPSSLSMPLEIIQLCGSFVHECSADRKCNPV